MAPRGLLKTAPKPADVQASCGSSSVSTRSQFQRWLTNGNAGKYSSEVILSCMDQTWEYAVRQKIATGGLWEHANNTTFRSVYQKLIESRQLRITNPNGRKVFIVAGQLYLRFLKKKRSTRQQTDTIVAAGEKEDSAIVRERLSNSAIDPEDVIAWLTTQPNANGTAYLERVVRQYMRALRTTPSKLKIPDPADHKNAFSCRTTEELTTYWDMLRAAPDYQRVNRSASGMLSAGLGCYMKYLQHLSVAVHTGEQAAEPVKPRETRQSQAVAEVRAVSSQRVDFNRVELCAQTRPLTCTINGQTIVPSTQNWSQLLVAIAEQFIADGNPNLESLSRNPLYGRKAFFLPQRAIYGTCAQLSNGNWIYTGYNPQIAVTIIRNLCLHCGVHLDDVVMTCAPKGGGLVGTAHTYSRPACATSAIPSEPALDPAIVKQLSNVLSTHFSNGYRLNSPIELARFKSFFLEDLGEEVRLSDKDLTRYVAACGTVYDGKVYAVSTTARERIKELVDEYFAEGAQAIFFAEFFAKNETWLFEASVVSEEMLAGLLRVLFPQLSFTKTYFGSTDTSVAATLQREILRVWGDDTLLTYDQLAERLRYVPLERIKYALGENGDFVWSRVGTFSHVSRIVITDKEREAICEAAMRQCNACGYAPITNLPVGSVEERHYELSVTAIHSAVYRLCLSDRFDKKGKIVMRKGDAIDALTIMKEHCRTVDRCSLGDLLNFEKELTGETCSWIPIEAGNAVLVRIDKDTYVADKYVHFDSNAIDEAIDLFVEGDYLPLKSFTTFGAFPDCGQTWNLFLLESYCRRFSWEFRFDTPSVNSRNAGVVIRRSCGLGYTDILADAVARSGIRFKDNAVAHFLFAGGYMGRTTHARAAEIMNGAKAIRARMG